MPCDNSILNICYNIGKIKTVIKIPLYKILYSPF